METFPILLGRRALITGSIGWDMGAAIAITLAKNRVNIVLNFSPHRATMNDDLDWKLKRLVEEISTYDSEVVLMQTDTRFEDEVGKMVEEIISNKRAIDILVNNGGGGWAGQDFTRTDFQTYEKAFSSETRSASNCIAACLPLMRDNHWGRIVNIGFTRVFILSSRIREEPFASSWVNDWASPRLGEHWPLIMNHGVGSWILGDAGNLLLDVNSMRAEQRNNITINSISLGPGWIERWEDIYNPLDGYNISNSVDDDRSGLEKAYSQLRTVANTVLFFCSEQAKFITGAEIYVHQMD
ncbi:MAG: SDR family NAD(P)-dependent oxidoreductase [Promethearchaeota archaeon]